MTLAFPFALYGYVYDSNNDLLEGATVTATGDSSTTDTTDSSGRYTVNLMDYATSGGTVTVTCNYEGETVTSSFTLDISDPGKSLNLTLTESNDTGDIYENTHKRYGNELYIFNSWKQDGYQKSCNY